MPPRGQVSTGFILPTYSNKCVQQPRPSCALLIICYMPAASQKVSCRQHGGCQAEPAVQARSQRCPRLGVPLGASIYVACAGRWLQIDIVVGIHNEGSTTLNITMIAGSLNSPADFNTHIQNFTEMVWLRRVC